MGMYEDIVAEIHHNQVYACTGAYKLQRFSGIKLMETELKMDQVWKDLDEYQHDQHVQMITEDSNIEV